MPMRSGAAARWALFDTALGRCALAWVAQGLTGVRLPARDDTATARGWPVSQAADDLPAFVAAAVETIQMLLAGQAHDLRDVPLVMDGIQPFERRIYEAARALDPGQTCTYGELARRIGEPAAMRAVGAVLGANPWPIVIPCHRVLAAGGKLGGFSAPGGLDTKRALLLLERTMVRREGELF
jgi:methylated-DNA-[protein]-cysteine S-methyltransferase